MRLSLQTDLALRILLYLATHPGRSTVQSIATFYGISEHHLGKVAHQLGRLGWVHNQRGPHGGLQLVSRPEALSVGDVVCAFEARSVHLLDCIDMPGVCVIQPGCRLRTVLMEAEKRQLEYLESVSIAELLPPSGALVELKGLSGGEVPVLVPEA